MVCVVLSLFSSYSFLVVCQTLYHSFVSDPFSLVVVLLALFHALSVFSNSFIIEEHWIHLYAVQSFALFIAFQVRSFL